MAWWLFACCALVFAIVVVGGITRLTHSGLSIVQWQPVAGVIPPLERRRVAGRVRALPGEPRVSPAQLRHDARGLQGASSGGNTATACWGARSASRSCCRSSGSSRGAPSRAPIAWRLAGIFALGGLQGALGWFMVKSGLVDDPRVSSVRLAAHLGTAFLIYAAMLWLALGLATGFQAPRAAASRSAARLRARGDGVRDGAHRSAGGGHPCGLGVQHVAHHERRLHPAGALGDRPVVDELREQHHAGAARPPAARLCHRGRRVRARVARRCATPRPACRNGAGPGRSRSP